MIKEVFVETYAFLWRNRYEFLRRAVLPFAAMVVVVWYFGRVGLGAAPWWATVIVIIGGTVLLMHFTVAWHRLVLFGPAAAGAPLRVRFGVRELKFFGVSVLSNAVDKVSEKILDHVDANADEVTFMAVSVALLVVLLYLTIRLCLVLPAIAADDTPVFPRAWQLSRGHFLKMLAAAAAVLAPLLAVWAAFVYGIVLLESPQAMLAGFPVYFTVVLALLATFLSTVYLRFTSPTPGDPDRE